MRILMVSDSFYPNPGGMETVVRQEGMLLAERGHEVHVLTGVPRSALSGEECWQGLRIHRFPVNDTRFPLYCLSTILNAGKWAKDVGLHQHYDVVNFHSPLSCLGVCRQPVLAGCPRVFTFHGPWHKEFLFEAKARILTSSPWNQQLLRRKSALIANAMRHLQSRALSSCQAVRVLSRYSAKQLRESFPSVDPRSVHILAGGVDVDRFHPSSKRHFLRRRLGLPDAHPLLLTVRRLVPRMGLETLLEAMARLVEVQANSGLVIVGTGPYEASIRARASQLGLNDKVVFTGYVREPELPLFYQAADLFLLPSKALEGFGLATMEALSSGLPVLASRVGANAEILRDLDESLLLNGTNAREIVDGIGRLLKMDGQISRRCREFAVEVYDWRKKIMALEQLYQDLSE